MTFGSDLRKSLGNCCLACPRGAPVVLSVSAHFHPYALACKESDLFRRTGLVPRANRYIVPGKLYHLIIVATKSLCRGDRPERESSPTAKLPAGWGESLDAAQGCA